jgi:microcystin-dependent protein
MSEVFIGSLMLVPYNFAPKGFAFCAGQILSIAQNTALFSLLGTTYGGDGRVTFALPDLRGRLAVSSGQGPGLEPYDLGQVGGTETETLQTSEMPPHTHSVAAFAGRGVTPVAAPQGAVLTSFTMYAEPTNTPNQAMSANAVKPSGNGQPHENRMPYTTLNWVIALQGIFPQRP